MSIGRSLRKRSRGPFAAYVLAATTAAVSSCAGPTAPTQGARVEVTPDSASLDIGQQMTLRASVLGSNGRSLKLPVYWSTQDSAVATVSSTGVVTAQAAGRVQVAASSNGVNGSATITVKALTVASIGVEPDTVSVQVGATDTLRATLYAASGQPLQGIPIAWGSSDQAVATVSSTGVVTGAAAGTATIMVAAEGQSSTVPVTVTAPKHHHHHDSD